MGCQASKASKEVTAPTPPTKTLLEDGDTKKVVDSDSVAITSAGEPGQTISITEDGHPHSQALPVSADPGSSSMSTEFNSNAHDGSQRLESVASHGTNPGLLRKHRTLCTSKPQLDIAVVEFSSHDSTVGSVLGRNSKEMRWKVMYDRDADPIDIKVGVQEHKLHSNEVEIMCNGQHLLHGAGSHTKAKLSEDFRYQWPFRGSIQGINERHFFEVRPAHFSEISGETWFPATITGQREDGCFEVTAQEKNASGMITETKYPAVHKDNLREAASKNPLAVPENCLLLEVPKQDPLRATLSLANGDLLTHHFGRPSPPRGAAQEKSEIAFKVSKDRSTLTATAGHQVLSHFVSGEVQAKASDVERLRHSWTVQVGPFAQHTVEVTKRHTLGKIVTLLVDGEVLVEASAADIGCGCNEWQCKFRLIGERVLDFEVHKTNTDGGVLDETGHVKERRRYEHECFVTIPNDWDFSTARFLIDNVPFTSLPMESQRFEETNLTTSPLALNHSYGISTPFLVDRYAPSNMMMLAKQVLVKADDGRKSAGGFFARWCDCGTVVDSTEIQQA